MIITFKPFDRNKNIGAHYNQCMNLLNDGDYAVFVDGDTQFLTYHYGQQLYDITEKHPNVGVFTCFTNRVNCRWQILPGVDQDTNDILYHRKIAQNQEDKFKGIIADVTNHSPMSGVFMMISKQHFNKIGKFPEEGMLGIDNWLHEATRKVGGKVYLMQGLYIYHYYRNNNKEGHKHLLK